MRRVTEGWRTVWRMPDGRVSCGYHESRRWHHERELVTMRVLGWTPLYRIHITPKA